jgi:RNA polymerase sigma factor (sigma-70 family)
LDRVFNKGTATGLTEGTLLERFVQGRDEAAFGALVTRHGPMVLGVCRRILRDEHDALDAFQATFLILVRRAGAIKRGELVSHWLYGVARRVAVRAKAQVARRQVHEPAGLDIDQISTEESLGDDSRRDLRMVLDEELARLPRNLRAPVVLCYLEGLTHDEAARRLRWPVGTIRSRLARARDRLRRRLTRQGFVANGAALSAVAIREPVALGLIDSTIEAALGFVSKPAAAAGAATSAAAALARGVLQAMVMSKIKFLGAAAVAGVLVLGGARSLARQHGGTGGPQPAQQPQPAPAAREDAMYQTMVEVERTFADMARQQQDLQKQLSALADQIRALRAARDASREDGAGGAAPQEKNKAAAARLSQATAAAKTGAKPKGQDNAAKPDDPRGPASKRRRGISATGAIDPQLSHVDLGQQIFVATRRGDRLAVFDKRNGKSKLLELPLPEGSSLAVTPISGPDTLALNLLSQGDAKVSEIAVYALLNGAIEGRWYPLELREPVDQATPIVGQFSVAYVLGRFVYAFSSRANRWDVLELRPGTEPQVSQAENEFKVEHTSHIYTFNVMTGHWDDIDLNAIFNPSGDEVRKDPERKPINPQ